jgi:DNA-binding XRE family transcriptional regulator
MSKGPDMPNMDSPLVAMRLAVGLTQKDIAVALGKAEQSVRNWEHGKVEPKLTIAETKKLCEMLGKTLDELPDSFVRPLTAKENPRHGKARKQLSLI